MPLRKTLIEAPLSTGLDQKSDNRLSEPQEALGMQNLVRLKTGAIRKRFGHTALGNSPSVMKQAFKIFASGTSLGLLDLTTTSQASTFLWLRNEQVDANWIPVGAIPIADVLDRVVVASFGTNPVDYDIAITSTGIVVVIFWDGSTLSWTALDGSGASPQWTVVQAVTSFGLGLSTGILAPKLSTCGSVVILTYVNVSDGSIRCQSMQTAAVGIYFWTTMRTLTLGATAAASLAAGIYDAAPVVGDATRFAVTFEGSTTNSTVLSVYSTTDPFTKSTTKQWDTQAQFNTFKAMCLQANNNGRYWVTVVATAGAGVGAVAGVVRIGNWNENGNTISTTNSAGSIATGVPIGKLAVLGYPAVPTKAWILWSSGYANGVTGVLNSYVTSAFVTDTAGSLSVAGGTAKTWGIQLASRPIYESTMDLTSAGSGLVAAFYHPSLIQGSFFTAALEGGISFPLRALSNPAPRLSKSAAQPMAVGGSLTLANMLSAPAALGSGNVYVFPKTFSTTAFHQTVALSFVELTPTIAPAFADRGNGQVLATGSMPWCFDGQYPVEPNFLTYPEIGTVTPSTLGGSMAAGTYQYIATWEWYDAKGQLHQSGTSIAVTATIASGTTGSVQLQVSAAPLGYRVAQQSFTGNGASVSVPFAAIVLYRTTAGGTVFYRQSADPSTTGVAVGNSNLGSAGVTLTDTVSDTALTASATAQLLYTTGGVLDNLSPPAARAMCLHKSRWFLAGCEEPQQVWPSSAFISGVCPGWNEAIAFLATGAVRALASLDDKLVIFVQRGQTYGIEYVTGDGPNNLGTQSDWSPPQAVQSDTGAVDQRAVCPTPYGVLFRGTVGGPNGSGGIFLLGRDLTVAYVSGPVEDTLKSFPVVTSMVLHPNTGRVYITCVQADYVSPLVGIRLVWDYEQKSWTTDTVSDPDNAQVGTAGARAACVANQGTAPTYHWVAATGRVYRETNGVGSNSYTDAGTWITAKYVSAWLKPALAGFARFWHAALLGDVLDPSDLTIQLTYDYAPSSYYQESTTFTAGALAGFDRAPQIQVGMTPGYQKAEAIQITLTDATPTGGPTATTGQGASWSTISLELGVKDGRYQNVPQGQRT